MNKIIAFFCIFLVCIKSEIRVGFGFEVGFGGGFEVEHFENNITIREVYYSDNNDVSEFFEQEEIVISICENINNYECRLNFKYYDFEYIRYNTHKNKVFNLYDCFEYLHPKLYLYRHNRKININNNQYEYYGNLLNNLHSFIERFYLYNQFEKINQNINNLF